MNELSILFSKVLLCWLTIQVCLVVVFLLGLRSSQQPLLSDGELPKTAVILCLRGADPYLGDCLRSLFNQNYPKYDLKLIIDRQEDPSWQIAIDTIQAAGATNVQIDSLRIIRHSCSLKCSSLLQVISDLDNSYQVIALVDADTIVHANWLRELVNPLADPQVGATTGNRWYLPTGNHWGSLVRYIWNVSTVVQMSLYSIPWGGSLAIKTEVLHQTEILDKWSRTLAEDTMIRGVLKKHHLKVKFVPSLIMLNREECKLPNLIPWLKRQILAFRLYHPWWAGIVVETVLTVALSTVFLLFLVLNIFTQQWNTAVFSLGCYIGYILALLLITFVLEREIQKVIYHQQQPMNKLSFTQILKMLIGIPLTHWVYGLTMLSSLWMSKVKWRGITYQVKSPWNIRLLDYRPYQLLDQPNGKISL
ncbi:glycosyltransferase family 2 protein [Cronbergia sp. UHCC 0137]|uniref:glycosyltransferase n=1 Tax=Cronbergia sp. UHCC 0137 TaxID=3110239 RepID=UPI002B1FE003|nr:glycosyltransferase family 2 protein [Cronbergia sp. UHCC 0137]MEA5617318.1 glycosyltransferase family 2 protein [Cronbergia sp. UHCC 0137]